jgi:hypothetical protein
MPPDFSNKSRYARVDPRLLQAQVPQVQVPSNDPGIIQKYGPMVIRGAGALSPGGPIGALVGGGTELGAQWLEGKSNPYAVAANAALGAIPGGKQAKLLTAIARGAGESALGTGIMQQAEEGLHIPTADEAKQIALSGGIGAATGGILHGVSSRFKGEGNIKTKEDLDNVVGKHFKETPTVTVPTAAKPTVKIQDPNLHGGVGDPNLAGSVPYAKGKSTPKAKATKGKTTTAKTKATTKEPVQVEAQATSPELIEANLPKSLAGAKPRYKTTELHFDNDIDKALYTVANTGTKSARHDDYMDFLTDVTGLDHKAIIKGAQRLKKEVGILADLEEGAKVKIPRLNTFAKKTIAEAQDIEPQLAGPRVDLPDEAQFHSSHPDVELSEAHDMPEVELPDPMKVNREAGMNATKGIRGWFTKNIEGIKLPRDKEGKVRWSQIANAPKAVRASTDVSAPLRQGIVLARRKSWWQSLKPMVKALREDNYEAGLRELEANPFYKLARDKGVSFSAIDETGKAGEEAFGSEIAKKIPIMGKWLIAPSERAYTTFLNNLRVKTFEEMVTSAKKLQVRGGKNAPEIVPYTNIASYINTASGRGRLGFTPGKETEAGKKAAEVLNLGLFSPRFIASRMQLLNPATYHKLDPFTRKEAMKDMTSIMGIVGSAMTLAKASGMEAHVDPFNDKDFGKIGFGKTKYDLTGGFGPYLKFYAQALKGVATGGEGPDLKQFGESKLSPTFSIAAETLSGKDYFGKEQNRALSLSHAVTPMIINDFIETMQKDPDQAAFAGISNFIGIPASSYERNATKSGSKSSRGFSSKAKRKSYKP